jgi:hypothetical protein
MVVRPLTGGVARPGTHGGIRADPWTPLRRRERQRRWLDLGLVGNEATRGVIGDRVSAIGRPGAQPDACRAVMEGTFHADREEMLAKPTSLECLDDAEIPNLRAGLCRDRIQFQVSDGCALHKEYKEGDLGTGKMRQKFVVGPRERVDPPECGTTAP